MTNTAPQVATVIRKPRQGRSPAFPFISLQRALERAEAFRVAEGGRPRHFAPLTAVAKAWGMGAKTGPAIQTVAALGHFGLFEFQGSGEKRSARLTDVALRILLDKQPNSPERDELIRQLALAPRIHAELWQKWQTALPSDATLETYLVRDRSFSESGARDLMGEYKATIAFAKLAQPDNIPADNTGALTEQVDKDGIEIGDLVRIEIGGQDPLGKPVRVRAVQEYDDGSLWVFVDGEETGIPMEQVALEQKGQGREDNSSPPKPTVTAPRLPLPPADDLARRPPQREGWSEERLLDDGGDEIFISYKGSPSVARYEFIRDFLNFKLSRLQKPGERRERFAVGEEEYEVRAVPLADRWLVRVYKDETPISNISIAVSYAVLAQKPGVDLVGDAMQSERARVEKNLAIAASRPASN